MYSEGLTSETTRDVLFIKFALIGRNKIDVAYNLEQMVSNDMTVVFGGRYKHSD